jgi:hypothetical protein
MNDYDSLANVSFYNLFSIFFSNIENFRMIFLGIVIEALPFILIGVFVSALINNFVSEDFIRRLLPKNKLAGIVSACFVGILFPICECGIVPITGRLIKKGLPVPTAIALMLAAPVINPVVAFSTASAFNGSWIIAGLRLSLAFIITILISLVIGRLFSNKHIATRATHSDTVDTIVEKDSEEKISIASKLSNTLVDSCNEFFDMGKYLLTGALLSTFVQTFVPYNSISSIGQDPLSSVIAMMAFAFGLSVCSTSDAFIASSFASTFTFGSILSFMVLGPMLDMKNMIMFFKVFSTRLIVTLVVLAVFFCGVTGIVMNYLLLGGIIL